MSSTVRGDMAEPRQGNSARLVVCAFAECGRGFLLCSHCDRGNKYCSRSCAAAARRVYLVAVRRKYAASPEALADAERAASNEPSLQEAAR
jgi:hypothetical protein